MFKKLIEDIKKELTAEDKKSIRRFIDIVAAILVFLTIIIVVPSVIGYSRGNIEGINIINISATVLAGYLGFIGAVVGILGTYGAFYLGSRKEKEKEIAQEKKELEMLKNVIEYTLNETDLALQCILNEYIDLYEKNNTKGVLMVRCYENQRHIPWMIEELITDGLLEDDKIRGKTANEIEKNNHENNGNIYTASSLNERKYEDTYNRICDIFNEINYKELLYDRDWYNYITNIPNREKYELKYVKRITDWFVFLSSESLRKSQDKIENLLEDKVNILVSKGENSYRERQILETQILETKKKQLKYIMNFIEYRDEVVDVFEKLFDNIQRENELTVSYKYLESQLKYDEWTNQHGLKKSDFDEDNE